MLLTILLLVLPAIIWWIIKRHNDNPLKNLPGPPRKLFFGNALELMKVHPNDIFQMFVNYTKQYGERYILQVMHLWVLQINNPADIEVVLSHTKNIRKSFQYRFMMPWLGSGLLLSTGSKWHKRRKILTPTFHFNILKSFFLIMEEKSRGLVATINESKGKDVDLLPVLSDFTLYTICETAMGTQLDLDKSSAAVDYKNAISEIAYHMLSRVSKVWLHFDPIFKRTTAGKDFEKCLNKADAFAEKVIMERRKHHVTQENETEVAKESGNKVRLALLDLLLEAEKKGEIDLEGIREEVNTFMFGGHDTTAIALTFCLMLLADHEDVQEQIYEECQSLFERCEGNPSMADFSEMKYLEAVIKESLRLYPSVPMIGREVDEDFMMRDLLVKKGTEVSINLFSLHRREDLYPEPDQFKPERFLNGEIRHPYAFLPFSAGPRNCIGQRYAMVEMKCFLYEIMRNFKLEPKIKGWRPKLMTRIVVKSLEPIYVKFIPRS